MRIAFYAPLKGPDHPVPSGDRQMARLLLAALGLAGHSAERASPLRSFAVSPDAALRQGIEAAAEAEVEAIARAWTAPGQTPPDLWLTYHPFYKAPDLLGPRLAARFGFPYATAEASHAPKRAAGAWAAWHAATEGALRGAAVNFCLTEQDREGLEMIEGRRGIIVELPPFIEAAGFADAGCRTAASGTELVSVAMMRPGDKLRSFLFLAEALRLLPDRLPWHLSVVGDGPGRPDVLAAFAPLGETRVTFLGENDAEGVRRVLGGADLYVWPGFNEAYGVGYLEAGAAGLPALAMRCGGIPSVVRHGETGVLVPEGDIEAYAEALSGLIADRAQRRKLGTAARRFVTTERTVACAAAILDAALRAARETMAR